MKGCERQRKQGKVPAEGSQEARRRAAGVLEVLAGVHTPADAARALGLTTARYYALEQQALEGLIKGCELKSKGRRQTPERQLEDLRLEVQRLRRECDRQQALARTAQRAVGLSLKRQEQVTTKSGKVRKAKKPNARALVAARLLKDQGLAQVLKPGPNPSGALTSAGAASGT